MAPLMETLRANLKGRQAYKAHAEGNRLLDAEKYDLAKRKHDQALALYDEAAALGCVNSGVRMAYSLLLMRYGRLDEAKEVMLGLQGRADLTPADKKQLRINYAVCLWKMGDLDRAIALMKEAGSAGMTGTIYSTLGLFLLQKAERTGDYTEAADFCAKALDYDDEDADALDNMGALHMGLSAVAAQAGDAARAAEERRTAIDYYDKALAVRPRLITALYARAKLHHEDGADEQARELLDRTEGMPIGMLCPVTRAQIEQLRREADGAS